MSALALHVAAKDARQLRAWLAAFLAVVVVRAGLTGASLSLHAAGTGPASFADTAELGLVLLHLGLVVSIAVQLVQVDRLVGTTVFWVSRPIPRLALLSAKLLSVVIWLILVPCLLDVVVMAFSPATWSEVLGAVAEGFFVRLALVVPVMALASVTADLAVFVLAGVAIVLGTLVLEALLTADKLLPWRHVPAIDTAIAVGAALALLVSLAALAHQVLTRRTGRTVLFLVVSGLAVLHIANQLDWSFLQPATRLETDAFDTARVTVKMTPMQAVETRSPAGKRSWLVRASCQVEGAPPGVRVVPLGLESVATFADGTSSRFEATDRTRAWGAVPYERLVLSPEIQAVIGDATLLGTEPPPEEPGRRPIALLSDPDFDRFSKGGVRFDTRVTLGALASRVLAVLPLDSQRTAEASDRRLNVRPPECARNRCVVEVLDERAGFAVDLRRPSSVVWLLVNRSRHEAVVPSGARDADLPAVFGRLSYPLLAQHLSVQTVLLWANIGPGGSGAIDSAWLRGASLAAIEFRDIGSFTVRAKVTER